MTKDTTDAQDPVVIKKYANRRLYNTESSSYVTLDHLAEMVKDGRDFVVRDAKSGEDITRSVLTQIIFEQENKGQTLLPIPFLRQLISFYGTGLQAMVPTYLQSSMEAFTRNQEQISQYIQASFAPGQAMAPFDEMARQNMAMFEQAMRMCSPCGGRGEGGEGKPPASPAPEPAGAADSRIEKLQDQLAAMQKQLDSLTKS